MATSILGDKYAEFAELFVEAVSFDESEDEQFAASARSNYYAFMNTVDKQMLKYPI